MPFIGQEPQIGAYHVLDSITASATATYNLQLNGGAFSPASANHLLVSLNGVIQKPGASFNVSGSQITFSSALTSSDNINFIMALGNVLDVGTPTDASVGVNKIASNAVTTAKIADDAVTGAKIENNPTIAGNLTVSGTTTNTGLITASAGVSIGSGGTSNTIDDYEEGIWTATLTGSGNNPNASLTTTGFYTKVGSYVSAFCNFSNLNSTGASGSIRVTGLPYAASLISCHSGIMIYSRFSVPSGVNNINPYIAASLSEIRFYYSKSASAWGEVSHSAGTGFYLWCGVTYITAS